MLNEGHLPVFVKFVLELQLGSLSLLELNTIGHGRVLGEDVLATSSDNKREAAARFLAILHSVKGFIDVSEGGIRLLNEATETGLVALVVVGEPILVVSVFLNQRDTCFSVSLGIVFEVGANEPVFFKVDVCVKLNFNGFEASCLRLVILIFGWLANLFSSNLKLVNIGIYNYIFPEM